MVQSILDPPPSYFHILHKLDIFPNQSWDNTNLHLYAQLCEIIKKWYLYGLALVHFNDMEVKTVDSFPRGQKNWFEGEVVSYIHKNLWDRKGDKTRKSLINPTAG